MEYKIFNLNCNYIIERLTKHGIILVLIILIYSCKNTDKTNNDLHNSAKHQQTKPAKEFIPLESDNNTYNDSMMKALIEAQLPKEEIDIDRFEILHSIQCQDSFQNDFSFSMESALKFQEENPIGSQELRQALHVSHCISKFQSNDVFDAYIFFSDIIESHTSQSFMIISIQKEDNTIDHLDLAIQYGNEQGDYVLESTINQGNVIERVFNHNMRYIEEIGPVDSIFLERELYKLNEAGLFEKLQGRLEPSTVRNYLE